MENERCTATGIYYVKCIDSEGKTKWEDTIHNVITDVGANLMLDCFLGGSLSGASYMGLISSAGYTGVPLAADTMTSHATVGHVWYEAGNGINYPNWSTPSSNARGTCIWSASSGRTKSLTSAITFIIATNGGTIQGCFIVTGSGAVSTNNNTSGTLYSAGIFSGGAKTVSVGDTVNVSYSTAV
jgi:hypothetical protein